MTKIDSISGFLGVGKTTLIRKILEGKQKGERIALIENEFDFVPGEKALTRRDADYNGRICVIGQGLNKPELAALFKQD